MKGSEGLLLSGLLKSIQHWPIWTCGPLSEIFLHFVFTVRSGLTAEGEAEFYSCDNFIILGTSENFILKGITRI